MLLYEKIKLRKEVSTMPAGVVFVLDPLKCPVPSETILDFHLLDKLKTPAGVSQLSKVEEFKL